LRIDQFHHTAWTLRDGAPPDAWAIEQTPDGALWLGTPTGLFRFDGVTFQRYQGDGDTAVLGDVADLFVAPDGDLWIGMRFGEIFRLRAGKLTRFDKSNGLPGRTVYRMAVDRDNKLWAATAGGLYWRNGASWILVGAESGIVGNFFMDVLVDRHGALWCVGPPGGFVRPAGSAMFQKVAVAAEYGYLAETPDGSVWFSGNPHIVSLSAAWSDPKRSPPGLHTFTKDDAGTGDLIADRDGGLWLVSNLGVGRIARPMSLPPLNRGQRIEEAIEQFGHPDGLSGDSIQTLLEDDAGNIWVASNGGIDRFRIPKLQTLDRGRAAEATWAQASDGTLWTASRFLGLARSSSDELWVPNTGTVPTALHAGPDGSMWIGTDDGLYLWTARDGYQKQSVPPQPPDNIVQAITGDRGGTVWVSFVRSGVYARSNGRWLPRGGIAELPVDTAVALASDERGGVWAGYTDDRLAYIAGGRAHLFLAKDGVTIGAAQAFLPLTDETWVGGSGGVARVVRGQIFALRGEGDQRFEGTSGVVMSNDGALWLNFAAGIARITAQELSRVRADSGHKVSYELLDHNDGLRGVATQLRPLPSAFKEASGRLWFSTGRNLHWVDPERIPRNSRPPVVEIRGVKARGKPYSPSDRVQLPVGADQLDIDYTALSVSMPEKVRFRYRLEGVDREWQDAGARRTAFYTNLSYGERRFTVIAANEDGVWNTTGASMTIIVPPAFYQARWFQALAGIVLAVGVWQLYRLRMRRVAAALRLRLEGRQLERERIARELHDTLLQSTQGLILAFSSIAQRLPIQHPARQSMERTLDRADAILAEGRDRVQDLRAHESSGSDLYQAFWLAAEELQAIRTIEAIVRIEGSARKLQNDAREQVYRIGREALVNAFKHSEASRVEVILRFEADAFMLQVRDDGKGAAEEVLAPPLPSKHWGMKGMQERARSLGAKLAIHSAPGEGTRIELQVPGATAFQPSGRLRQWSSIARVFQSADG
jgi:signal transduction histidine kinase/ligand-binding sensor domain-containing protein